MSKKINIVKLFTLTGNLVVPCYAVIFFFIKHGRTPLDLFMLLFVCFVIIERAWETFCTSKEHRKDEYHGDWTLVAVTSTYLLIFFIFIPEFFLITQTFNYWILGGGLFLWLLALRLRFWGMSALGKQWAVHAVGPQKIRHVRLIELGPYKRIRHPIYLAIMIEELSFPIIANAPIALFFVIFVCIPLVVIRAFVEEKTSLHRFGEKYLDYKQRTGMFFPRCFSKKVKNK